MSTVNYGSKRIVTGAGYGFRDWLAQRVTGTLMALFTVILLDLLRHPFPAVPRLGGHA